MPQVPSTRWTVFDVLSASRELAKTVDQKRVIQEQGKYFYKIALSEIVTLLNSSVDPSYITSTPLTLYSDIEFLINSYITSINTVSKTITRSDVPFKVGSYINITLISSSNGSVLYQWTARISVGGKTATYILVSGNESTYSPSAQTCSVIVEKSNTNSSISADISTIGYDRIISIEDSLNGQCVEVSPQEFASLGRLDFQHKSYEDDIVWCLVGNAIRFRNGSKAKVGTKTMWYQRQPDYPINWDDTDKVDLADKWIPLLIMKIYTLMILQNEPDIPKNIAQEMQTYYQLIPGFNQAESQNKVKDGKQVTIKN